MLKALALSDYFKIIRPQYIFLKLTPVKSIRNYNSDKIAKAVAAMYRNVLQQFKKYNKQIFFECPAKVGYYIYIEKNEVGFYFIIPSSHLTLFRDKIGDTWKGITVKQVDTLPSFSDNAVKYKVSYRKEDAMSLAIDKRTNTLLSSLLNVIDVIEEGDKCGIFYNFIPYGQFGWRAEYKRTIDLLNDNKPIDYNKMSVYYAINWIMSIILEILNGCLNTVASVIGSKFEEPVFKNPFILTESPILPETRQKKEARILETQIILLSESEDMLRKTNNAYSIGEAFKSITGDNELVYNRHRKKLDLLKHRLDGVDAIKTSTEECGNFIALPARELIESHKNIDHIDTYESEVPKELQQGKICIGTNTYKGKETKAYLTSDKEYQNCAMAVIAPNRAGKSTFLGNYAKDAVTAGECVVVFDFCGSCQLSSEVAGRFTKDRVLNIECDNPNTLQGLGYNEVPHDNDVFKAYRNAKVKVMQLLTLTNTINEDDKSLSAKMDRYLESAALVVFISDGSIKDVFSTLQNHIVRHKYISMIPKEQSDNLEEYVQALSELDEKGKNGEVIGTRFTSVSGIIDRINKLKQNAYVEMMLKKDCKNNINLLDEMQKPQLICLKMPEVMFATDTERDIYCTYWITKIWLALQIREWMIPKENRIKVNIIVDELYQVESTQTFIRDKLNRLPKFNAKVIISCHYLGQIGIIRRELEGSNTSYMLISGCDKTNFDELKEMLAPYTLDDLLCLKRYHSLNLLKYEKGYATFITELPKPV